VKKNLFILVIVLLCFKTRLLAQEQSIQFYYYNSDKVRSSEQNFQYFVTPYSQSILQIRASSTDEKRLHFNQDSNHSKLAVELFINKRLMNSRFETGYEYLFDDNDLEVNLYPYQSKTAFSGYGFVYHPLDSLAVYTNAKYYYRSENDRYHENKQLISKGYSYQVGTQIGWNILDSDMGLNAYLEQKKLEWDYYRTQQFSSYLRRYNDVYAFHTNFTYSDRKDDFYILEAKNIDKSYQLSDTQNKQSYLSESSLQLYPTDNLNIDFSNSFANRHTLMSTNSNKDNNDFSNNTSCQIRYDIMDDLNLTSQFQYNYNVKDFAVSKNSRQTQFRNLSNTIAWEFIPGDSLITLYQINLQRTEYPDDEHKWDNDLRDQTLRLGLIHYWNTRVKLVNWLILTSRDDVYPNALLSSNNNRVYSISWHPECNILLGDRLVFMQAYNIRTDYTDFTYNIEQQDNLYRQLHYQYRLLFDSYPYVARSGDSKWLALPYRKSNGNTIKMELSYQYEQNEYGDKAGDYYNISTKIKRHVADVVFKYEVQNFYYTLQPKYSWGTWKEYAMLLGVAWQFNRESLIELSINPFGESPKELDWQMSFNVNMRF